MVLALREECVTCWRERTSSRSSASVSRAGDVWEGSASGRTARTSLSWGRSARPRSEEHTSELQSPCNLVCRLLLEKKKIRKSQTESKRHNPDVLQHRIEATSGPLQPRIGYPIMSGYAHDQLQFTAPCRQTDDLSQH